MTRHCCETMTFQVERRCEDHPYRFDCPDALVEFSPKFGEYGLIFHDGGSAVSVIDFCPWCGARLPESQRDRWYEELERLGIDLDEDEVPPEYQDDRWLHPGW
ncbi:DUF6980 family protein [Kitasatospora sp. NPDC096147]|uniref:DUF6980 family protein n=1 Tax=Kitasatospora sp. NPDC096147 TaxID=3364093 RepID=UPI0037F2DAAD